MDMGKWNLVARWSIDVCYSSNRAKKASQLSTRNNRWPLLKHIRQLTKCGHSGASRHTGVTIHCPFTRCQDWRLSQSPLSRKDVHCPREKDREWEGMRDRYLSFLIWVSVSFSFSQFVSFPSLPQVLFFYPPPSVTLSTSHVLIFSTTLSPVFLVLILLNLLNG